MIMELLSELAKYDMAYLHDVLRRAKGYTVSLYEYQKRTLSKSGGLYPLAGGIALALDAYLYDEKLGLCENQEVNESCGIPIW